MPAEIRTHLLPGLFEPTDLEGAAAVMIDVLRASTTITTALANGALAIWPCQTIEQALELKASRQHADVLLGGERGGERIDGFDLSNSPADYSEANVAGRTIAFTTTNGTLALKRCAAAQTVYVGCFLNLSTLAAELNSLTQTVHLVCAGTNGQITSEDALLAGLLALRLCENHAQQPGSELRCDDSTQLCMALADQQLALPHGILRGLEQSQGGRNLAQIGLSADIAYCSQIDLLPLLPVWDHELNRIQTRERNNA